MRFWEVVMAAFLFIRDTTDCLLKFSTVRGFRETNILVTSRTTLERRNPSKSAPMDTVQLPVRSGGEENYYFSGG